MRLEIFDQAQFDEAVRKGRFETATTVRLKNLPGITAVPDLPAAIYVRLEDLPGITTVPLIAPHGRIFRNGSEWR